MVFIKLQDEMSCILRNCWKTIQCC